MNIAKPIAIALLVHLILLSFVWVGFPVGLPVQRVEFAYSGSIVPAEDFADQPPPVVASGAISVKTQESAFFAPWVQMRDITKPRK